MRKKEETNKNIRSWSERTDKINGPLLLILASLETETTQETNDDAEEPVEADSLKELQSHT